MRIGIMTYWTSDDNYGQQLQCYALQKYLISQGHDAFLIRYTGGNTISLLRKIKNNLSISKILYRFTREHKLEKKRAQYENKLRQINKEKNVERRFEEFRNNNLQMSEKIYTSIEELRNDSPVADVYICGSDQVWNNPLYSKNTAAWFLSFGNKHVKRISYAASIGRELDPKELMMFKGHLSAFDAISVREDKTKILCENIGVTDVQVTLDPTLLLPVEKYYELSRNCNIKSNAYIFLYILNVSSTDELYWENVRSFIDINRLDLKLVCSSGYMPACNLVDGHDNIMASVSEWLALIHNAYCIITTSFHGVIFCIKMHKPFLAIMLTNRYSKGNARIQSFLKSIGLEDRIFDPNKSCGSQMQRIIDWPTVDERIDSMKQTSIDFLTHNIGLV